MSCPANMLSVLIFVRCAGKIHSDSQITKARQVVHSAGFFSAIYSLEKYRQILRETVRRHAAFQPANGNIKTQAVIDQVRRYCHCANR